MDVQSVQNKAFCLNISVPQCRTCREGVGGTVGLQCGENLYRSTANRPTATCPGRGSPPWGPGSGVGLSNQGSHCLISHPKAAALNVGHAQTRPAEEGGDTEVEPGGGDTESGGGEDTASVRSPGSPHHHVATKAQRGSHLQQGHTGVLGQ